MNEEEIRKRWQGVRGTERGVWVKRGSLVVTKQVSPVKTNGSRSNTMVRMFIFWDGCCKSGPCPPELLVKLTSTPWHPGLQVPLLNNESACCKGNSHLDSTVPFPSYFPSYFADLCAATDRPCGPLGSHFTCLCFSFSSV